MKAQACNFHFRINGIDSNKLHGSSNPLKLFCVLFSYVLMLFLRLSDNFRWFSVQAKYSMPPSVVAFPIIANSNSSRLLRATATGSSRAPAIAFPSGRGGRVRGVLLNRCQGDVIDARKGEREPATFASF
jgi:hypothetical protein